VLLTSSCMAITAAATDLALGIVQRRTDMREGTPARSSTQDSILASAPAPTPHVTASKRMDVTLELDLVLESPVLVFPRNEANVA
jgi:hypothetical protein